MFKLFLSLKVADPMKLKLRAVIEFFVKLKKNHVETRLFFFCLTQNSITARSFNFIGSDIFSLENCLRESENLNSIKWSLYYQ